MPPTATNPLPLWLRVDSLVLFKSQRRLTIYFANQPIRSYRVALGGSPVGPKHVQRDGRTPEGVYVIDGHNVKSQYHRSLHVSYPNAHDLAWAGAVGKNAGGDVMIHGVPDYAAGSGLLHAVYDWTSGCAAVTDEEIEELFRVVRDGTPIRMLP